MLKYLLLFSIFLGSCSSNIINNTLINAELEKLDVDSTFVLYDGENFTVSNKDRAEKRVGPASTFKIVNSLIALETQTVKSVDDVFFQYKGETLFLESWQHNMNLREAISVSNLYAYQQLARLIGAERMQEYIAKLNYGNKNIGTAIDEFWVNGSLEISPMEQAKFLMELAYQKLPISKKSQEQVKDIIFLEDNGISKLYGKTGLLEQYDSQGEKSYIGWFVGFVEKENRYYSFAFNMDISVFDSKLLAQRVNVSKKLLQIAGVL